MNDFPIFPEIKTVESPLEDGFINVTMTTYVRREFHGLWHITKLDLSKAFSLFDINRNRDYFNECLFEINKEIYIRLVLAKIKGKNWDIDTNQYSEKERLGL